MLTGILCGPRVRQRRACRARRSCRETEPRHRPRTRIAAEALEAAPHAAIAGALLEYAPDLERRPAEVLAAELEQADQTAARLKDLRGRREAVRGRIDAIFETFSPAQLKEGRGAVSRLQRQAAEFDGQIARLSAGRDGGGFDPKRVAAEMVGRPADLCDGWPDLPPAPAKQAAAALISRAEVHLAAPPLAARPARQRQRGQLPAASGPGRNGNKLHPSRGMVSFQANLRAGNSALHLDTQRSNAMHKINLNEAPEERLGRVGQFRHASLGHQLRQSVVICRDGRGDHLVYFKHPDEAAARRVIDAGVQVPSPAEAGMIPRPCCDRTRWHRTEVFGVHFDGKSIVLLHRPREKRWVMTRRAAGGGTGRGARGTGCRPGS